MKAIFLILVAVAVAAAELRSFKGYEVYRLKVETKEQYEALLKLQDAGNFDFWKDPCMDCTSDLMVAPHQKSGIIDFFNKNAFQYSLMIEDVEQLVEVERKAPRSADGRVSWDAYYSYDEITTWLNNLGAMYAAAETSVIGQSYEGRDLTMIKISTGNSANKKAVWLDSIFHSREWISAAFTTYVVNQLVTNTSAYNHILDHVDVYVLPLANPDGYEYSRNTDRMWRKTRRENTGSICRGVDPNRNFGYEYGGAGTSTNPCSDIFRGPEAFSESETKALEQFVLNADADWLAYVTVHSYGQYWLTPWGYDSVYPENYAELKRVGDIAADELRSYFGTDYIVGTAAIALYPAAGGSDDWALGSAGISYSYTLELRDEGRYGFILPPDQIMPTSIETWGALQVAIVEMINATK